MGGVDGRGGWEGWMEGKEETRQEGGEGVR